MRLLPRLGSLCSAERQQLHAMQYPCTFSSVIVVFTLLACKHSTLWNQSKLFIHTSSCWQVLNCWKQREAAEATCVFRCEKCLPRAVLINAHVSLSLVVSLFSSWVACCLGHHGLGTLLSQWVFLTQPRMFLIVCTMLCGFLCLGGRSPRGNTVVVVCVCVSVFPRCSHATAEN